MIKLKLQTSLLSHFYNLLSLSTVWRRLIKATGGGTKGLWSHMNTMHKNVNLEEGA